MAEKDRTVYADPIVEATEHQGRGDHDPAVV